MTAFLHRFTEKHDVADTEFLVDAGCYNGSDILLQLTSSESDITLDGHAPAEKILNRTVPRSA